MRKLLLFAALAAAHLGAQTNPCAGLSLGLNGNFNGFHPFPGTAWTQTVTTAAVDPVNANWQSQMGGYYFHPDGGAGTLGTTASPTPWSIRD